MTVNVESLKGAVANCFFTKEHSAFISRDSFLMDESHLMANGTERVRSKTITPLWGVVPHAFDGSHNVSAFPVM